MRLKGFNVSYINTRALRALWPLTEKPPRLRKADLPEASQLTVLRLESRFPGSCASVLSMWYCLCVIFFKVLLQPCRAGMGGKDIFLRWAGKLNNKLTEENWHWKARLLVCQNLCFRLKTTWRWEWAAPRGEQDSVGGGTRARKIRNRLQGTCSFFEQKVTASSASVSSSKSLGRDWRDGGWSGVIVQRLQFQFGMMKQFWKWIMVTAAQHCEST